ncbi:arylsulfotransferase family protein [Halorussus salinisoli]|uniref:arylsulfotransferase family protein n=1 Tax=Halorussus salinisoli TaxID=2558242 RepID=UPI0010C21095|nr:aryl-sulfate sulfotransferase [Halorussus salinisoli]
MGSTLHSGVGVLFVSVLFISASAVMALPTSSEESCIGTMTSPADGTTVLSIQGYNESGKQPAKLVGVGPQGEVLWVHHNAEEYDAVWSYDVDPMENGNLFVTAAIRDRKTVVYEFNPRTQKTVWETRFDIADTHDADLINNGTEILVANMRNYNETTEENDARIFVYNRSQEKIVWEWQFDEQTTFTKQQGAPYERAWTHVNDVDKIGPGEYLISPRNFDQAIVVNRSTKRIEMRLGADNDYTILNRPHNPDYLESANDTPTLLVADSTNNRIVEYANPDCDLTDGHGWTRTWTLTGDLKWPRDADRLANGNTLIADTKNHRVIEVTPTGRIVWEVAAPWLVYDVARVTNPGESGGPTIQDQNATGSYETRPNSSFSHSELVECHQLLQSINGHAEKSARTSHRESAEEFE